ncbi:TonB-dependent siderophore receptor [Pelagicoccus albus]|uniref:TonB-dependent receptor n=1 Tax=Pelagicoccus albus TaxID=415222 RepID=A0A7X1EA34_9BACT|nr:TonB-dependent receptor [Pelagicoccus albus]MBC2608089.1 TonB-dependent receptor [Pelagicoccus albus]
MNRNLLVPLIFALASLGYGQQSEQIFELSPFSVSPDASEGYRTKDIVTGTKIATPLMKSPLTVGVVNQELLDDINVDRVTDAVAFTQAGVANTGRTWQDQETFVFRGYEGTVLRNGVRFTSWTDTSNIERVEVAKGPSAILYGFVAPGGVVNYVTKRPHSVANTKLKARYSSNYGFRGEFDINRPLLDSNKLMFRLTGSQADGSTWIQYQSINDLVLTPTLRWQATPNTTVDYEFSYRKRKGAFERIRFYYLNKDENFESLVLAPYNDELGGTVGYDWNPGITPWADAEWTRRRSELRIEHKINDHFRFLAIGSDDYGHVEQVTSFTNFKAVRNIGYEDVQVPDADNILLSVMPIYENVESHNQYLEANLLAQFQTEHFKSNTLVGISANRSPSTYPNNGYYAPDVSLIGQIDYTLESPYTVRVSDPLSERYYRPDTNPEDWELWFTTGSTYDWGRSDLFLTQNISAIDDKLNILGGIRRQQYRELQIERTLPQIGVIYELTPNFSPYVIWSETAESNGRTVRYKEPRPLSESKAWDAGFKFDMLESKLTGSFTYFNIEKTNLAINDPRLIVDYAAGLVDDTVTFTPGSESKGYEASVQYQPNPSFQMITSFAKTDARILPGDPNPEADNAPLVQVPPESLTFFGRYKVNDGRFEGLSFGGGFVKNWGPVYVDNPVTQPLANEDGNFQVNAFVRYSFTVNERDMSIELSGSNLTDDRWMMNGGFSPPREIAVSTEIRF